MQYDLLFQFKQFKLSGRLIIHLDPHHWVIWICASPKGHDGESCPVRRLLSLMQDEADDELYWQVTFVECQSCPWTYGHCLTLPVSSSGPTWPGSSAAHPRLRYLLMTFRLLTLCLLLVMFEPSALLTKPITHTRAKGPNSKQTCFPENQQLRKLFFLFFLKSNLNSPLEPGWDTPLQACI